MMAYVDTKSCQIFYLTRLNSVKWQACGSCFKRISAEWAEPLLVLTRNKVAKWKEYQVSTSLGVGYILMAFASLRKEYDPRNHREEVT